MKKIKIKSLDLHQNHAQVAVAEKVTLIRLLIKYHLMLKGSDEGDRKKEREVNLGEKKEKS